MHILQIVVKNTSTLDFTLPILWKLRARDQSCRISILYCVFDKRQILRSSRFYSNFFKRIHAEEYDFADFLKRPWHLTSWLLRALFSSAPADKVHLADLYRTYRKGRDNTDNRGLMAFLVSLFQRYSLVSLVSNVFKNGLARVERAITPRLIHLDRILPTFNADTVLFDNRATTKFPGRELFFQYFSRIRRPVVLLPHAPHLRDPVSEFCPFDEHGEVLPSYCNFWMPLRFGTPWVKVPDKKDQFSYVGYPGLDSEWLDFLRKKRQATKLKCLVIIRRYLEEGEKRPADLDPYIIDYDEFIRPMRLLAEAVKRTGKEIDVIIKPHPANNYKCLARDLKKVGLRHWSITHEPVFALLQEIDLVVSLFSTILLVPAMSGIPTLVLNSKLQRHVHEEWSLLRDLYTNMEFYVEDLAGFSSVFANALNRLMQKSVAAIKDNDINHLRYYFPSGATEVCLEKITALSGSQQPQAGNDIAWVKQV